MIGIKKEDRYLRRGDKVWIGEMPPQKRHFTSNAYAIVEGNYNDLCIGHKGSRDQYGLYIKGHGYSAWYNRSELTLIERCPVNFNQVFAERIKSLED